MLEEIIGSVSKDRSPIFELEETAAGLHIKNDKKRWWLEGSRGFGNASLLSRVVATYPNGKNEQVSDLYEICMDRNTGEPQTVIKYPGVPAGIDLTRPLTAQREIVLSLGGKIENRASLDYLCYGPVKSLQETVSGNSDFQTKMDEALVRNGLGSFNQGLAKLRTARFKSQ
ncbi:hypothetical protein HQ584_07310 [Patescibacteria group bacterium]|nr:hypothetical protein [Patescibacteria group bacterium]